MLASVKSDKCAHQLIFAHLVCSLQLFLIPVKT